MTTLRVSAAILLRLVFLASLLITPSAAFAQDETPEAEETPEQSGPVFAFDQWRVSVAAAVQRASIKAAGLEQEDGNDWLLVVADVTNWGDDDATLRVDEFSIRFEGDDAPSAGAATATTTAALNLRAAPSTDAAILALMPAGTTVTLTGQEENGFLSVNLDGQDGWAAAANLALEGEAPSGGVAGNFAPEATLDAAKELDTEPADVDAGVEIAADATERVALVFQVPADSDGPALFRETALPLADALERDADLDELPPIASPPPLEEAEVDDVVDGARLDVLLSDEEDNQVVRLIGVDAPTRDDCFAEDAADGLDELAGGTVYLERGVYNAVEDELVRYVWVEQDGNKVLLNHQLVAQGLAASNFPERGGEVRFKNWMDEAERVAQRDETGLWGVCEGPHGDPLPPPPTPTPSAEEIRAQYTPLADVRELVIRPGGFIGEQIAFSGSILTIQVAPPGDAFFIGEPTPIVAEAVLQVGVVAPDGSTEYISVGYNGDTTGMFEGTFVSVYGTVVGVASGTNAFGGTITDPLVEAELVELG